MATAATSVFAEDGVSSFLSRVCTFPRTLSTFSLGHLRLRKACRRTEEVPTTAPAGRESRISAADFSWPLWSAYVLVLDRSASPSRARLAQSGRTRQSRLSPLLPTAATLQPLGSLVGTSFRLCTMISTSPASKARSKSSVQSDLPADSALLARVCKLVVLSRSPREVWIGWTEVRRLEIWEEG